jgi:hypothetical protein
MTLTIETTRVVCPTEGLGQLWDRGDKFFAKKHEKQAKNMS